EDIQGAINKRTIEEESKSRAERISTRTDTKLWVAQEDEKIIGFVEIQKQPEKNKIRALYVLPEYQNQGIGSVLIKKALYWLGDEKALICEVVSYNTHA